MPRFILHVVTRAYAWCGNGADPDAEVVSLSPRTLLESDRYVCEICGQGFQRDQNLQMHRRRHKVPWKLLKREAGEAARKRVFVCPEPSCLHHDPSHALGDLVGIKKHFRRKHSGHRQWACARCSKAYAVHSDYKAHLKTCGTRGHSCDCGRVFSRVESFIEHQDTCNAGRAMVDVSPACGGGGGAGVAASGAVSQQQAPLAMSLSRTVSSTSPSSDIVISPVAWPGPALPSPAAAAAAFHRFDQVPSPRTPPSEYRGGHNLELQLMPQSCSGAGSAAPGMAAYCGAPRSPALSSQGDDVAMQLQLSIGVCGGGFGDGGEPGVEALAAARAKEEEPREQLRQAMAEKAEADEARAQAKRHAELAEQELAGAKRMRRQAQVELSRAHALREHAVRQVNAMLLQITCLSCRHKFSARLPLAAISSEVACSNMSSVVTEGGDAEVDETHDADGMRRRQHAKTMDVL
ncbi:protein indeterminate-domain 16-like isoform X2 [Phragmites australis]|uniref:protein indeterminate-domain 16-like isoform X2 n=1 Tax=Phragmites australis TaxID=29695 RepID=UPI002D7A14E9|nr:protein indeterminate-domain 16-like isoform X2 [Phragmites australis]